jgi:HEAT repeat protein
MNSSSTEKRRRALIPLLKDQVVEVRQAAAAALESLEGANSVDEVLELLKKGNLVDKVKAIYALGDIGGSWVVPPLLYCAARPEEDLKAAAIDVLGRLADPAALPVLKERLRDPSPGLVAKTIVALGNFSAPEVVGLLVPFLDAGDGLLDAEALQSLARIGGTSLEDRFLPLLASPHSRTREAAARALGRLPLS